MHQTKKNQNYSLYVYGIYTGCLNTEKHYAVLQAKFKTTAAYWLLVVFAALGLVFSTQETEIPLNRLIFACIICLIGIIGNQMFWYEDMVVQERFQSINLFEAMKLEYQNRWLPQLHQTKIFSHKTILRFKNIFYVGSDLILFIIMNFILFFLLVETSFLLSVFVFFMDLLLFLVFLRYIFVKTYRNELSVLKELIHARK